MKIKFFACSGRFVTEQIDDLPKRLTDDQLRQRYPWPHFQHVEQMTNAEFKAILQNSNQTGGITK